jgi:hypothetical protein
MDNIKKKKTKKSKIKKLPKISNEIIPIKNLDKRGEEVWTDKKAKDIGNFPSPARVLLIGSCGTGKSTVVKNLIIHKDPPYDEIFLIHADAGITKEYDDLDCTDVMNEVPDISYWDYEGKHKRRAVICDDLELTSAHKERLKNLAILFRYCSTHKGLSIYFAHQSWFDLMPLIKKMSNVFVIWKPKARNELTMIENRVGMKKDTLKNLFKTVATKTKDSICIDFTEGSPAPLRLNIWTKLKPIYSDSDEDESDDDD